MSLKAFQTILDLQTKVGALAFYQKPTPGNPQGRILEASFSRPNVGAASGATVFDKDGVLQELSENEPDWDFPIGGGCPVIKMRPQSQNLCTSPIDISAASKVNVTIPNATQIREDGSLASEFFAFQDFSGFSSSTDYTMIIEVEPVGGRNFRLQEGLGSSAITNIDFEAETASGSASLVKQGNGKFLIFLPITTGASQTSIRFLMRVLDGSLNTSFDGDVNKGVNITLRDIQAGHEGISPIPNNVTRSANQFTFDNLVSNGIIDSSAFTFLLDFKLPPNAGVNGSRLIRFRDVADANLLELVCSINGTSASWISGGTLLGGYQDVSTRKKLAISVNGNLATVSLAGSTIALNVDMGGSLAITKLFAQMINGWGLDLYAAAFAPLALSEGDINAATT